MPTKPHFVVDPSFPRSKEVLSIPRRYRLAAIGAWTAAGAWSTDVQSDGHVSITALEELGVTPLLAEWLVTATLWTVDTRSPAGGDAWTVHGVRATAVQFTNWPKWQKTKEQWAKGATANADRQRRYRQRRSGDDDATALRDDDALPADGTASASEPDEAPRNASSRVKNRQYSGGGTESLLGSTAVAQPPPPSPGNDEPRPAASCAVHPNGTPEPCIWCEQNRKRTETAAAGAANIEAVKRVDAKLREAQRRRDCWDCDDVDGRVTVYDDDGREIGVRKCTHPEVP